MKKSGPIFSFQIILIYILFSTCIALCMQIQAVAAQEEPGKLAEQTISKQAPGQKEWLGVFASFPGARLLCRQHVTGSGSGAPRINWSLYATDSCPEKVRAFYSGHPGEEKVEEPVIIQLRIGKKLLSVYPAEPAVYPRCGVKPKAADRTVIIVSELVSADGKSLQRKEVGQ